MKKLLKNKSNKNNMYQTLKILQDNAEASDNIWLSIKLKTLEVEIYAELKEAEDRVKSYYNEVILKQD